MQEKSIQSLGGEARKKALSAEQRAEIAKKAADARWGLPVSHFEGEIELGTAKIPCAVVEINGETVRLINSAGFMKALGRPWKGSYKRTDMPNFLEAKNLEPFISKELRGVLDMVEYRTESGSSKQGYRAEIVPLACEAYLSARDTPGALHSSQQNVAKACEIIMRSLAKLGILALVDEATGYQEIRDRKALQKILEKYIKDDWAKWTRRFPLEFYQHLFRLKNLNIHVSGNSVKPSYVGHWTNDIVYDRLAPGIKKRLREVNPKNETTGRRTRKHHQHLTEDIGIPELQQYLSNVIFLMRGCQTWDEFKRRLDVSAPKFGDTMSLPM
ncbi:MAG: P63C domain-containing protein [Verrucomicrobia bacterium]|nr:P63C domain-containing protein [Verrucomicrobiota bacterium]